jgi:hypothetical protein
MVLSSFLVLAPTTSLPFETSCHRHLHDECRHQRVPLNFLQLVGVDGIECETGLLLTFLWHPQGLKPLAAPGQSRPWSKWFFRSPELESPKEAHVFSENVFFFFDYAQTPCANHGHPCRRISATHPPTLTHFGDVVSHVINVRLRKYRLKDSWRTIYNNHEGKGLDKSSCHPPFPTPVRPVEPSLLYHQVCHVNLLCTFTCGSAAFDIKNEISS